MEKQIQENNISQFSKGLYQDNSFVDSPKGTYRFALNSVNETELGDSGFIGNEESNEIYTSLTPGYTPIGKCYIGNNINVIFSVSSNNNVSEIGILDDNGNYTVHVNDASSPELDKLNFKVEQQIQATYRLRRGCERTIYFVGKGYPPRYYNFDKPNQFKDGTRWSAPKFRLFKRIEVFPTIDSVEVLNTAGSLTPGSYTVMVQHLDEDLNGTEFYELVKDINIYNDSLTKNFTEIEGSANISKLEAIGTEPFKYGKTSKAIKITLDAVDMGFTYIRFAFVERTSGNGQVSAVKYSDIISVNSPTYTYTGTNANTIGTIEEVELFNLNSGIGTVEHIEQIDNMLILANVKGGQENVCKLQKYASKITTDCFVKDIILTSIEEDHNPKNPLVVHNGLGYQPDDIYSLGIVYVYDDYTISPVLHLPGKSSTVDNNLVYSPGDNVYPMSNINNQNSSETYLDENSSCPDNSYWGTDAEGINLKGQNVRHHRFPTRDAINVGFVKRTGTASNTANYKKVLLNISGAIRKSSDTYDAPVFTLRVKYKKNGIEYIFSDEIFPDSNIKPTVIEGDLHKASDVITDIRLYYVQEDIEGETEILLLNNESAEQPNRLTYKITVDNIVENNTKHIYEVPIFGLKFSNVELPSEEEIGKKVIGYQIVRQERTDNDKNVLDSGVVFPMLKSGRNVATAMLAPDYFVDKSLAPSGCEGSTDGNNPTCFNVSKNNVMLLSPLHKFMDKTHDSFTSIKQVGTYQREYTTRSATSMQNVYDGTSATGDEDNKTDDDDGFSLRHGYRFNGVKYIPSTGTPLNISNEDTRMYNLEGINYAESEDGSETLYNLACDNKALVVSSNKPGVDYRTYRPGKYEFPYVYVKKDNANFYQNFRSNPYYLVSTEVFEETTCQVFGGDTYIVPMRYSNHIFGNAVSGVRRKKMNIWAILGAVLAIIAGIILSIASAGLGTGAAIVLVGGILTALGGVVTGVATILESSKFTEIYLDKWEKNLDKTVFDYFYASLFIKEYPEQTQEDYLFWEDDTFRWFGDIVGDLWFETTINVSLRVPPITMENNYLLPLKSYMNDRSGNWKALTLGNGVDWVQSQIFGSNGFHRFADAGDDYFKPQLPEEWFFIKKITEPDSNRNSGVLYTGISVPIVYLVNPDHAVNTGIKKFYTIPVEYDCCSDCRECFPHRIHYSLQSFQEEKADNYRMFLPNNYRDIEGETGEITNLFRLYNNLYAHTEEALWQMGRNYQERVTDSIVSFIGTGSYFEIPPQKVLDDDIGSSAGCTHKWSSLKTPAGYFFISENQRKVYQFTGKELNAISNNGISNWFKNNIEVLSDRQYIKQIGKEYPNRDNPSNVIGTGFLSTYDTRKERVIFTKKDLKFRDSLFASGSEFCINGNIVTFFNDINQTIIEYSEDGWIYQGIENCRLKFKRTISTPGSDTTTVQVWHDPVYEDVVDESVVWLNQVCVTGNCGDGGSGACSDGVTLWDINGNPHGFGTAHVNFRPWTECFTVNAFVSYPVNYSVSAGGQIDEPFQEDIDPTKVRTVKTLVSDGYWETVVVETPTQTNVEEFTYVDGQQAELEDYIEYNNSWTMSYSLKSNSWISWHSYIPNFYINVPEKFYSWKHGNNNIWKHNVLGLYQTFYGEFAPHILEYVSTSSPLTTKIWNTILLQTEAKTYNSLVKEYYDERYITFNKAILYNSRQCSGEMDLIVKDSELNTINYMMDQVINTNLNHSIIDRTERDWFINDFRDIRTDYSKPIWNSDISSVQSNYYIDKVLNTSTMNINKDWTELESFRDKYLVVRLIFDKFADKKLITNFSVENEQQSFH